VIDVAALFRRQAAWQKTRASLSWPEKIRLAEQIRESITGLKAGAPRQTKADRRDPQPPSRARDEKI
jgi:hypothetical protein